MHQIRCIRLSGRTRLLTSSPKGIHGPIGVAPPSRFSTWRRRHDAVIPASSSLANMAQPREDRPIILFDIMDTVVVDPFFTQMPAFFGLSFKELMAAKHPTAWPEFERGEIDEAELLSKFFLDGRPVDGTALRNRMTESYAYVPGMPDLLEKLKGSGYQMHAMSNYPEWWQLIEAKLNVSTYLEWTFVSCTGPMKGLRKPSQEAYAAVSNALQVPPGRLLFIDDRMINVEGAIAAGMDAIHFSSAYSLQHELRKRCLLP